MRVAAFFVMLSASGVLLAPSPPADPATAFLDNGTIRVGRDPAAGGWLCWASESGGPNLINVHDLGRGCQAALFDTPEWNPTQAGDGANSAPCDVFFADREVIFSRSAPLLYYNGPQAGPPRRVEDQRICMWTELLPGARCRAFLVRTAWANWGGRQGLCQQQQLDPCTYVDASRFDRVLAYTGNEPWSRGPISTVATRRFSAGRTEIRMSENWSATADSRAWGLACLSSASRCNTRFFRAHGGWGDRRNACLTNHHLRRFRIGVNAGESVQLREGWKLFYLGAVGDARAAFSEYRPLPGGDFSDEFGRHGLLGWDANTAPAAVSAGAVRLGPYEGAPSDLSLARRIWADAKYAVDLQLGEKGAGGIAFRKAGEGHFSGAGTGCYSATVDPCGVLSLASSDAGVLASVTVPDFSPAGWHTLSVTSRGFSFAVELDGIRYLSAVDDARSFAAGSLSLACDEGASVSFRNLRVSASGDSSPPAPVAGFAARKGAPSPRVRLTWGNPADPDWLWTRIVRKEGGRPAHWRDGFPCYEGKLTAYTDADVTGGKEYAYAAFAVDRAGNWSAPVFVAVSP